MELIKKSDHPEATDAKPGPQVNDISAPAPAAPAESAQAPSQPAAQPTNDANVAPAPQSTDPEKPKDTDKKEADKPKPVKPPKAPKKHGTGGAIFAAVVIVLALGAMFTYAYLRSNNISLF